MSSRQENSTMKIGHIRLADRVADALLKRIVDEGLQPGDRLPTEQQLGDEFGVSRTVVREAMRFLVARGVVKVRAGSGAEVASIDPEDASESLAMFLAGRPDTDYGAIHEIREVLEVESARRAAERRSEEDVKRLRQSHEVMEALVDSDDLEALAAADIDFHAKLAAATGNEILVMLLEALGPALAKPRNVNLGKTEARQEAIQAHGEILKAVQDNDIAQAEHWMRTHLDFVIESYNSSIDLEAGEAES